AATRGAEALVLQHRVEGLARCVIEELVRPGRVDGHNRLCRFNMLPCLGDQEIGVGPTWRHPLDPPPIDHDLERGPALLPTHRQSVPRSMETSGRDLTEAK